MKRLFEMQCCRTIAGVVSSAACINNSRNNLMSLHVTHNYLFAVVRYLNTGLFNLVFRGFSFI